MAKMLLLTAENGEKILPIAIKNGFERYLLAAIKNGYICKKLHRVELTRQIVQIQDFTGHLSNHQRQVN